MIYKPYTISYSRRKAAPNALSSLRSLIIKVFYHQGNTGDENDDIFPITVGDVIVNRYSILSVIHASPNSQTVSTFDQISLENVCIKILGKSKDLFDRAVKEIKVLLLLKERGDPDANRVIHLVDFLSFSYKGYIFIVTELLGKFLIDME